MPPRDVVARYLGLGATISYQLLFTPILIRAWGTTGFDLWIASLSSAQLLVFLDFGVEFFISNHLVKMEAEKDTDNYNSYVSKISSLYLCCSAVAMLLCIALYLLLVHRSYLQWWYVNPGLFLMLGCMTALQMPTCILTAIFRSKGDYALAIFSKACSDTAMYACLTASAFLGYGQLTSVIIMAIVGVAGGWLWPAWYITRRYDLRLFRFAPIALGEVIAIGRQAWPFQIARSYHLLFSSLPVIIIGALGPAAGVISTLSLSRTFVGIVRQVLYAYNQATAVQASAVHYAGDAEAARAVVRRSILASAVLAGGLGAVTVVAGPAFVGLWSGGHVAVGHDLIVPLALSLAVTFPAFAIEAFLQFTNRPSQAALCRTLQLAVGLASGLALYALDGLRGFLWGMAIGEIACVGGGLALVVNRRLAVVPTLVVARGLAAALATGLLVTALLWGASLVDIAYPLGLLAASGAIGLTLLAFASVPALLNMLVAAWHRVAGGAKLLTAQ